MLYFDDAIIPLMAQTEKKILSFISLKQNAWKHSIFSKMLFIFKLRKKMIQVLIQFMGEVLKIKEGGTLSNGQWA